MKRARLGNVIILVAAAILPAPLFADAAQEAPAPQAAQVPALPAPGSADWSCSRLGENWRRRRRLPCSGAR